MIPLKDENPTTRAPYVTVGLIILNIAIYVYQMTLSQRGEVFFSYEFGAVPALITGQASLNVMLDAVPRPLTLVTSAFLHGGILHLLGNMLYLWIFGNNIEDALGPVRFLLFYLVGAVLAGLAHVATEPASTVPMIGASGAIAAVLGAYLMLYPRANVLVFVFLIFFIRVIKVPAVAVLGVWFLLQVLSVGGQGVAWMAHIGGFVAGLFLIRFFMPKPKVLH